MTDKMQMKMKMKMKRIIHGIATRIAHWSVPAKYDTDIWRAVLAEQMYRYKSMDLDAELQLRLHRQEQELVALRLKCAMHRAKVAEFEQWAMDLCTPTDHGMKWLKRLMLGTPKKPKPLPMDEGKTG